MKVPGHPTPVFPLDPPTPITLPLTFATCVIASRLDRSARGAADRVGYAGQRARMSSTAGGEARVPDAVRV